MLGLPVPHHLLECAQVQVHYLRNPIQPSHPVSAPYSPALSLPQYQGLFPVSQLFESGGGSIGASALPSVLPMNIQD